MLHGIAGIGAVERLGRVAEHVALDEYLGAVAGVDAIGDIVKVRVDDMGSAEADRGSARVDVCPPVVGKGDAQVALILSLVLVRVADQRRLEVVVEVGVRHRHKVGAVHHVQQAVVVVLAVVLVRRQVAVVDPHVARALDRDGVAVLGLHLGDPQVAYNHVFGHADEQAVGEKRSVPVLAQNRLVGADACFPGCVDDSAYDDDFGFVAL